MATDPAFHFPPDLFEAVVSAVPLLVRAKRDVLTFFQGCGVSRTFLVNYEPWTAKDSGKSKYHITREVLVHVNELGDSGLRTRREILKRVSEFESYSSCWPDDQLKAQGAVALVAELTNKKDAFTRIQQERDRDRNQHREKRQAEHDKQQAKRQAREKIKNELFSLFSETDHHRRGRTLEGIVNRLFQLDNILIREAFTVTGGAGKGIIEQIDGAIEIGGRFYLVEMKWWNSPLGRGDVAPHLVSVMNRGGVGGIFISASGFHDSVMADYKQALTHVVVVLVELSEVVVLLERDMPLHDLLLPKIQAAALDRNPLVYPLSR